MNKNIIIIQFLIKKDSKSTCEFLKTPNWFSNDCFSVYMNDKYLVMISD